MTSTIKVNNIQNQCGANIINENSNTITLGASGDTIALASGASQTGFGRTGTVDWQTSSIKTSTFTAANGEGYFADTSSGGFTMNLPAGSAGNIVSVVDYTNTFQTGSLTIAPNGSQKIGGVASTVNLSTEGQSVTLVYVDDTEGWKNVQDSTSNIVGNPNLEATGGAVTTSGDFKIHTFTGPGTFTVTNTSSTAANNIASYLVLAGGASGGSSEGGGGGAGGFREYKGPADSYTASPLNGNPGGTEITLASQAYPITVGGGGASRPGSPSAENGNAGNPSVFSTVTSAGGGGGGSNQSGCGPGGALASSGGSGGGSRRDAGNPTAAAGNTPPVSPPQGNNGGTTPTTNWKGAGGGGGAGAVGGNGGGNCSPGGETAGAGGAGLATSITGSPVTRGGGGGGSINGSSGSFGAGGSGGGGVGSSPPSSAGSGTANTGGGGGGATGKASGAGGSGIVIIRYKFQ